jgi:hypothetical protein
MHYKDRIWNDSFTESIELDGTAEYLEITTDKEVITLDREGVHRPWLSLGRYERAVSRATNVR